MSDLVTYRARIRNHFLDPLGLVLEDATLDEGIRSALEQINTALNEPATISGLDGALTTTLDRRALAFLLTGGCAVALTMLINSHLSDWHINIEEDVKILQNAGVLELRFRQQLEELRVDGLQYAMQAPHTSWVWQEPDASTAGMG